MVYFRSHSKTLFVCNNGLTRTYGKFGNDKKPFSSDYLEDNELSIALFDVYCRQWNIVEGSDF